jgi:hypothetical protein
MMCGLDSNGSGYDLLPGCCEHGNEPLVSIKARNFFDQLSGYQLVKKHFAA